MGKVIGNALLNSTRQPVMCFTVRARITDPAGFKSRQLVEHEDGEDRKKVL